MIDDRSYTMGLFDGEGCITCSWDKANRFGLKISVQMNDEAPVRFMETVWGGSVYERTARSAWVWQMSSKAAVPFLTFAAEHSKTKAAQAKIALELAEDMRRYLSGESRKGKKPADRVVDVERRLCLVRQLRALNGARQRYTVT